MTTRPPSPPERRDPDPPWPPRDPGWRHDAGAPEQAFPVPFTILDAFVMVLWTLVAQVIVVSLAVAGGGISLDPDTTVEPLAGMIVQVLGQALTVLGLVGYLGRRGVLTWRVLGPLRPRWRHAGLGVGLGLVALVIVVTVAEMTNRFFGPFEQPEQFALEVSSSGGLVWALAAVSAVGFAPIIEETVFRSLLFQSTRRRLGLTAGLVISALTFTFVHLEVLGSPPAVFGLVALALWLAAAFHRTGSLVVPVTAHATYNLMVLALQAFLPAPT